MSRALRFVVRTACAVHGWRIDRYNAKKWKQT